MMKSKISKEVKIGISFVIALFLLYFGISFLKGVNVFKPSNSYNVIFEDVSDLTISSPVLLNGYQIGLVHSIEMDKNNPREIVTQLNLDKGIKIPVGSEIILSVGTLGGAKVVLKPDYSATRYYTSEDKIKGVREFGLLESVSDEILPQFNALVPKIDSILTGLQHVTNHPALTQSLDNVQVITNQLGYSTQRLNSLLASINNDVPVITSNIGIASDNLAQVTARVNSLDLASAYNSIDTTLANIRRLSEKINSEDNSIGLLLNDRQLYDSISTTLNNASLLLKDLKENPSRYINVKVF